MKKYTAQEYWFKRDKSYASIAMVETKSIIEMQGRFEST